MILNRSFCSMNDAFDFAGKIKSSEIVIRKLHKQYVYSVTWRVKK